MDQHKHAAGGLMGPREVIAGAASLWTHDYAQNIAERAMSKLSEHGYEIAKLPRPDHVNVGSMDENGYREYALGDVTVFDDGEIHLFGAQWHRDDVAALGLALLAAVRDSETIDG
ncbi:hypothetical protein [Mycolicibacterium septicum]|uniref:hypothetical protein n=1 Tax=Mycolicibacterium septicum TaxID=98668 RepID=UPI001AFB906D|nr:hypothetical protein [Mycolicibacterium septicum]QRY51813.1 hypothetical protein JVX95_31315 [Mycolicibacterium septicum]